MAVPLHAFVLGFAFAALALAGPDEAQLAVLTLALALGLGWRQKRERDDAATILVVHWRSLALLALLGALLILRPPHGVALILAACAGFVEGQALRPLLLWCGVLNAPRLHVAAWTLTGALAAVGAHRFTPGERAHDGLAAGGLLVLLCTAALPQVAAMRMPTPRHEPWHRGWPVSLGAFLAGAVLIILLDDRSTMPNRVPWAVAVLTAVPLCLRHRRTRRAGVLLGLAVGATMIAFMLAEAGADLRMLRWLREDLGLRGMKGPALVALAIFGVPAAVLAWAIPSLVRLYAGEPMGKKILAQIPLEERRAPDGGVRRLALLLLGLLAGPALFGLAAITEIPTRFLPWDSLAVFAGIGLLAAVLLIAFDPRAGWPRKAWSVAALGAAAALVAAFA